MTTDENLLIPTSENGSKNSLFDAFNAAVFQKLFNTFAFRNFLRKKIRNA
ncbi:hypothetical protein [Salinimicrobium sp. GXAS 041]